MSAIKEKKASGDYGATIQDTPELKVVTCSTCDYKSPAGIAICPACGGEELNESSSAGTGTIYTYTTMRFVPAGPHKQRAPYVIAVVETAEGMRVTAIVETDDVDAVSIGSSVTYVGHEEEAGFIFRTT